MNLKSVIKHLYNKLPFKKEFFSFIKFFIVPPKSLYQHLYFKGVFNVKIDHATKFKMHHLSFIVENEIFWEGLYNGWKKKSIRKTDKISKSDHWNFLLCNKQKALQLNLL